MPPCGVPTLANPPPPVAPRYPRCPRRPATSVVTLGAGASRCQAACDLALRRQPRKTSKEVVACDHVNQSKYRRPEVERLMIVSKGVGLSNQELFREYLREI